MGNELVWTRNTEFRRTPSECNLMRVSNIFVPFSWVVYTHPPSFRLKEAHLPGCFRCGLQFCVEASRSTLTSLLGALMEYVWGYIYSDYDFGQLILTGRSGVTLELSTGNAYLIYLQDFDNPSVADLDLISHFNHAQ